MVALAGIERIAVIDDEQNQALAIGELLREFGYEPIVVTNLQFGSVDHLFDYVRDSAAQAVVCDHRLSPKRLAQFPGAEAVARFYKSHLPSVLLTQFRGIDTNQNIREWRPWIPSVIDRQDTMDSAEPVLLGLEKCRKELSGELSPERRSYRSMVEVIDVFHDNVSAADVRVLNWHPLEAVRLPLASIPQALRPNVSPGTFFIAQVNIGAESSDDLFFTNFQLAPTPADLE